MSRVVAVSMWTGSPSLDVLEDRGDSLFSCREEALIYLKDRDFDAEIALMELDDEPR